MLAITQFNFQIRPQSGQGYFRLLEFSTDDDEVIIKTYSPVLNQYETDPDSEFSIGKIRADAPWTESQSIELPSGSTFSHEWKNLEEGKTYEWKVVHNRVDGVSFVRINSTPFTMSVPCQHQEKVFMVFQFFIHRFSLIVPRRLVTRPAWHDCFMHHDNRFAIRILG